MLEREPNGSGWQVTLRAQGVLRFLPAAFLCVWLCGWAMGEYFALTILDSALQTAFGPGFLAGWLPTMHGAPPPREALPLFFAFVSVWLTLWTFGGLTAWSTLLNLLFGREVICWSADGLEIKRYALFLTSASRLDPRQVTGFRMRGHGLLADTRARAVRVAQQGTPAERVELMSVLAEWRKAFGPVLPLAADQSPVPQWQLLTCESGAPAIAPAVRTQQAIGAVLMAIAAAFLGAAVAVGTRTHAVPVVVGALALGLPGVLCLCGATWLLAVREYWLPRSGVLEHRRVAFGRVWSREFTPLGLELRTRADRDGDARWMLVVSGGGREQVVASSLGDPNLPTSLGHWLAERTGVELVQNEQESGLRKAG